MTLTINLSDGQATVLEVKAAAEGLSVEEWIRKLAQPEPGIAQPTRHIAEIIVESMNDVPPEVMATMPGRREPARSLHLRLAERRNVTAPFAIPSTGLGWPISPIAHIARLWNLHQGFSMFSSAPRMKSWPNTLLSLPRLMSGCAVKLLATRTTF